jgi:hypothetical protein
MATTSGVLKFVVMPPVFSWPAWDRGTVRMVEPAYALAGPRTCSSMCP